MKNKKKELVYTQNVLKIAPYIWNCKHLTLDKVFFTLKEISNF